MWAYMERFDGILRLRNELIVEFMWEGYEMSTCPLPVPANVVIALSKRSHSIE
jgi:hypothetical protein